MKAYADSEFISLIIIISLLNEIVHECIRESTHKLKNEPNSQVLMSRAHEP